MNAGFNLQENAKGLTIIRVNPEGLWNIRILPGLLIQESIPSVSAVRRMIIPMNGTAHGALGLIHDFARIDLVPAFPIRKHFAGPCFKNCSHPGRMD